MSEDRLGPMRINQLGGGVDGPDFAPSPGGNDNQIDVPHLGRIDRGASPIHAEHNVNKAFYNKMEEGVRRLDHVRVELDQLVDMGDTVSPEDVVAAAGRVVAHGVPAREVATLLADMPTQAGQGLAAWLMQQDAGLRQQEAHFAHFSQLAGSRMAASAFRTLAAEHVMQRGREAATAMGQLAPQGRQAAAQPGGSQRGGIPQPSILEMTPRPSEIPQGPGAVEAT